tara:strand:- start:153 stop:467 length:315 start_codon:yes stop_codon:yes gene_type:complete
MKVYTQDKTIKILLSLIIIGLFLNFFKPTIKDALAADIDCLIMKDELMQRIALSENRLEEGIRMNGKFSNRNLSFNYLLAVVKQNISKDILDDIMIDSVEQAGF